MIQHFCFFNVSKNNASSLKLKINILILTCFNNSFIIYFLKRLFQQRGGSPLTTGDGNGHRVTLESSVSPASDVLFKDVGGEAVVLNLETGKYYGLDEVGARMWTLLNEKKQVKEVYQALVKEFEVSTDQLEHDLLSLVNQLANNGLLQVDET